MGERPAVVTVAEYRRPLFSPARTVSAMVLTFDLHLPIATGASMIGVQRVAVSCDFTPFSEAALLHGVRLAERYKAQLHLLHVLPSHGSALSRENAGEEDRLRSEADLGKLLPPDLSLRMSPVLAVRIGSTAREIIKYARDAQIDLLVMGTHGRTGLAHIALGSVAEKVVRGSSCPVLIVPRQWHDRHWLMQRAASHLVSTFGETLYGEREATMQQMRDRIAEHLDFTPELAYDLLLKMESHQMLGWTVTSDPETSPARGDWRVSTLIPMQPAEEQADAAEFSVVAESAGEVAPAIDLLQRALHARASDVHIDPWSHDEYLVRFRVDGRLDKYCHLDAEVAERLIHQYKMLGNLDIADPFRPKEGRLRLPPSMARLEARITTSPASGGEAVAMRLFSMQSVFRNLEELGLNETERSGIDQMLRQGSGVVLVTGPTGSGKTTTVYSMLAEIGSGTRNIVSIEDPVEFPVPFVRQLAVDERHGVTITTGLRTLLRMDPDVLFVGEIRDEEAAEIAMRAAASGKYVFSTLHTRDVAATITALRDLHVDNRSLAGNLTGLVNQRLVRRLCPYCRREQPTNDHERATFEQHGLEAPRTLFVPVGCQHCRGTGYLGRAGIFEVAVAHERVSNAIATGGSEQEIREAVRFAGTLSLTCHSLHKVRDGLTSLREAMEITWI